MPRKKTAAQTDKQTIADLDREIAALRATWEAARQAANLNPTAENRTLAKAAWAALDAASPRTKRAGFASLAGKRQAAEQRRRTHATTKKTAAQLDREIADALAAGLVVTITVHEDTDEETGEETYTISDDGGEFDDVEEESWTDVQGDIDERRLHYHAMGRRVVIAAPARLDLR